MKISKQRLPAACAPIQAEQIAVQRIGEISGPPARLDRVGRAVQKRPVLSDEMFPGLLVRGSAGARQRQIFEMQRGEIPRQLASLLPEGAVRLDSPVDSLLRDEGRVVGITSAGQAK